MTSAALVGNLMPLIGIEKKIGARAMASEFECLESRSRSNETKSREFPCLRTRMNASENGWKIKQLM